MLTLCLLILKRIDFTQNGRFCKYSGPYYLQLLKQHMCCLLVRFIVTKFHLKIYSTIICNTGCVMQPRRNLLP